MRAVARNAWPAAKASNPLDAPTFPSAIASHRRFAQSARRSTTPLWREPSAISRHRLLLATDFRWPPSSSRSPGPGGQGEPPVSECFPPGPERFPMTEQVLPLKRLRTCDGEHSRVKRQVGPGGWGRSCGWLVCTVGPSVGLHQSSHAPPLADPCPAPPSLPSCHPPSLQQHPRLPRPHRVCSRRRACTRRPTVWRRSPRPPPSPPPRPPRPRSPPQWPAPRRQPSHSAASRRRRRSRRCPPFLKCTSATKQRTTAPGRWQQHALLHAPGSDSATQRSSSSSASGD